MARAIETLIEAGAADAWATPIVGKKGRPGLKLSALCSSGQLEAIRSIFVRETPTLGIRLSPVERRPVDRDFREVTTPWGKVRVKLGMDAGLVVNVAPEHDDCLALAKASGIPLKQVIQAAIAAALNDDAPSR